MIVDPPYMQKRSCCWTYSVIVRYTLAEEFADDLQTALKQFTAIAEEVIEMENRMESTAT